jgi:hypothetical protein
MRAVLGLIAGLALAGCATIVEGNKQAIRVM